MKRKECILYDRPCTDCGECLRCDLDPEKICDNCGACLEENMDDFASILLKGMQDPESGNMRTLKPVDDIPMPELTHVGEDTEDPGPGFVPKGRETKGNPDGREN